MRPLQCSHVPALSRVLAHGFEVDRLNAFRRQHSVIACGITDLWRAASGCNSSDVYCTSITGGVLSQDS